MPKKGLIAKVKVISGVGLTCMTQLRTGGNFHTAGLPRDILQTCTGENSSARLLSASIRRPDHCKDIVSTTDPVRTVSEAQAAAY